MATKTIKTRIIHKHDTEAHWNSAINFIPKQGEIIIYDIDSTHNYERFKIGDGETVVASLPFATNSYLPLVEKLQYYGILDIEITDPSLFTFDKTTGTITGYSGTESTVVIPYKIDEAIVSNIGVEAFYGCTTLTNIIIPKSVTSIGGVAFTNCSNLTNITIPNSVMSIGGYAFSECGNLVSVEIPDGVTSIVSNAFAGCTNLSSITIPDSVTSIGDEAFYNCTGLTSVTIPDSVTLIGREAFYNCVDAVFYVEQGSYAEKWCKENNLSYIYTNLGVGLTINKDGEIFNDYKTNQALSSKSHAEGTYNTAGSMSFSITAYDVETKTFTLDSVEGLTAFKAGENGGKDILGDTYSCQMSYNYDVYGQIMSIDEDAKTVVVDIAPEEVIDKNGKNVTQASITDGKAYFYIPGKPNLGTKSWGTGAHAEGYGTYAVSVGAHSEGYNNISAGKYSHTEGNSNIAAYAAHAEGLENKSIGQQSHTEGHGNIAAAINSHAEGLNTQATGDMAHSEGADTKATGYYAHAEGKDSTATGNSSHSEGLLTITSGMGAHSEGVESTASGEAAHAEGASTKSNGRGAHAEGIDSTASGEAAHAEGDLTTANFLGSHAEGVGSKANAEASHAEGKGTYTGGTGAHAEGQNTQVSGNYCHGEGVGIKIMGNSTARHVQGKYNTIEWSDDYAHIVGNGESEDKRSDCYRLKWTGNAWYAGTVTAGRNTTDSDSDYVLVTKGYLKACIQAALADFINVSKEGQ